METQNSNCILILSELQYVLTVKQVATLKFDSLAAWTFLNQAASIVLRREAGISLQEGEIFKFRVPGVSDEELHSITLGDICRRRLDIVSECVHRENVSMVSPILRNLIECKTKLADQVATSLIKEKEETSTYSFPSPLN